MTMKVTEGHWKRHDLIGHTSVVCSNNICVFHCFQDIAALQCTKLPVTLS